MTHPYLSTCESSHQTHVGHGHVDIPRHAQSVMGPECSNYHEGSELCNIANGHPVNSAQRVLNNTEVVIYIYIYIYIYKLTTYLKDLPLQSVSSKKNLQVVDLGHSFVFRFDIEHSFVFR